jgi:GTP cyclohydrolase I
MLQSTDVPHNGHANLKPPRVFDQAAVEAAIFDLLVAIGEDPQRDGLRDTPARVARAYRETFAGLYTDPDDVLTTMFDEQHGELVLIRQIPMYSTCEHHLVSFHGVAHVGYLPGEDGRVTGLSKIARLVDLYARRPQVQERLTGQIAEAFMHKLHGDAWGAQAGGNHQHLRSARSVQIRCRGTGRSAASASAQVTPWPPC